LAIMCRHDWRGNVRELENVVERAMIFAESRLVHPQDLCIAGETGFSEAAFPQDLRTAIREFERQHIATMLAKCKNNKAATADTLGIGLSSLYRKIEELGIGRLVHQTT